MLTDSRRVELLIFPTVFLNVLECGVADKEAEDYKRCGQCLVDANREILAGLDQRRYDAIQRRVIRLHDALTAPYRVNGARVDKTAMTFLYALQSVLDADYLVLHEGSQLARAINAIIEAIQDAFGEPRLEASARKQAAKVIEHMQRLGLFNGIKMEKAA